MFGYVNIDKPNILFKDYTTYRAYYCGLCKCIGKTTRSQLMRFSINYDITFLTILAHNYRNTAPEFQESRCVEHIIGRKIPMVKIDEVQECVADVNTILGYYKLEDDVLDGSGLTKRFGRTFFKNKFKKAVKRHPALGECARINYGRLREMEASGEKSLDKLADAFAVILKEVGITAAGKTDDNLEKLCYNLGRWIYIIDAYDDLEKDVKEKKFNPFLPSGEKLTDEKRAEIRKKAEFSLKLAISEIIDAYDKMDITISEGALSNIIYRGLGAKTDSILNKRKEAENDKKPL